MRLFGALLLAAVALTPRAALSHEGEPINGIFAVSAVFPSAVDFCTSEGTPSGISVEAQGGGSVSGLGPLLAKITKCTTFEPSGIELYAGTFELTAGNGDTLNGTYTGRDTALYDANGFGPFDGTWTFTGGTGRFSGAISFTAVFASVNNMAYYAVQGNLKH